MLHDLFVGFDGAEHHCGRRFDIQFMGLSVDV